MQWNMIPSCELINAIVNEHKKKWQTVIYNSKSYCVCAFTGWWRRIYVWHEKLEVLATVSQANIKQRLNYRDIYRSNRCLEYYVLWITITIETQWPLQTHVKWRFHVMRNTKTHKRNLINAYPHKQLETLMTV